MRLERKLLISMICIHRRCYFSPSNTRPPSPTKSDTELDKHRLQDVDQSFFSEEDNTMWEWGRLPQTSPGIEKSHDDTLTSFKTAQSTIVPIPELEGQTGRYPSTNNSILINC